MSNADRYRQHLVNLCASLDDEGLEELTLRLARPEYPDAHRTRKGRDSGIDVLSDFELRPNRGWQAKNYTTSGVSWAKCKESLAAAMKSAAPPAHYTFVFPRALKASERDHWRDEFLKTQKKLYPKVKIDYWDDLASRLEDRSDLVDILNDGVLAAYVRRTLSQTSMTGVNPLASATDLVDDVAAVADHAVEIGATDPYYAYRQTGGEIADDDDLPDQSIRFSLTRDSQDTLPRYTLAMRDGSKFQSIEARVRPNMQPEQPDVLFAKDAKGEAALNQVRVRLARGERATLTGESVMLSPGSIPDRFRELLDEDGLLRGGTLEIGPSEPLALVVRFHLDGGLTVVEEVPIYRVPPLASDDLSWAGWFDGVVVSLDCRIADRSANEVQAHLAIGLVLRGEDPKATLRGLGFARAIARAKLTLECAGLLPDGGVPVEAGGVPASAQSEEHWTLAARIAVVLSELNKIDGRNRQMPGDVNQRDIALAELIERLLVEGEVVLPVSDAEFEVPLPADAATTDPPDQWMHFVADLPSLFGAPSLKVAQSVEGAEPLELFNADTGALRLRCRKIEPEARLVMRLASAGA